MKKSTILLVIIQLITIGALGYSFINKEKSAYIEISELYNGFDLKKELEAKFEKVQQERQFVMDSLKLDLDLAYKKLQAETSTSTKQQFEKQRKEYMHRQQFFEEDNQRLLQSYEEQIWAQLNQYIKDFGAYHSYDFIYGANGSGSMMYADKLHNVSTALLQYANEKYHGKVQ